MDDRRRLPTLGQQVAKLRTLTGAFLCAGLVDYSLAEFGSETIRLATLIQFHGGQIAD